MYLTISPHAIQKDTSAPSLKQLLDVTSVPALTSCFELLLDRFSSGTESLCAGVFTDLGIQTSFEASIGCRNEHARPLMA